MITDNEELQLRLNEINSKMSSIKKLMADTVTDLPTGMCASVYRDLTTIEINIESISRTTQQLMSYVSYLDPNYDGRVSKCIDKLTEDNE